MESESDERISPSRIFQMIPRGIKIENGLLEHG